MVNTAEIHALLITRDISLLTSFSTILRELGVDVQKSAGPNGVPEELGRAKYEAVLLDFDTVSEAQLILAGVRESPANRNAVIFGVATGKAHRDHALQHGANFVLVRPFDEREIRRVLDGAYDLMAHERRRYFRWAAEFPILLRRAKTGVDLNCTTINISSRGMAVHTPCPLTPGEEVDLALFLQQVRPAVRGNGTVIWDDKHGKAGISFQCHLPQDRDQLEVWLDTRLCDLLPSRHSSR